MPAPLPLFPLTLVLFPGATVPLHIFEPRYRRLVADCLAGDRRFGIVPVGAASEAPAPGTVGCVADLRQVDQLPDGRSNILVSGGARFRIVRYLDEGRPYLQAEVEELTELPDTQPSRERLDQLRALFGAYADLLARITDQPPPDAPLPDDPVEASFAAAMLLEADARRKQRLLATRSTDERCAQVLQLLPPLIAALQQAVTVHERARTNGKGGHHHDIATP